jgi:O-methyltransferase involved in polyketide biosynthesis
MTREANFTEVFIFHSSVLPSNVRYVDGDFGDATWIDSLTAMGLGKRMANAE